MRWKLATANITAVIKHDLLIYPYRQLSPLLAAMTSAYVRPMPTNFLRRLGGVLTGSKTRAPERPDGPRFVTITAGRVSIRAELLETKTADRVWIQLPIYSTVETWGASIHFETPVETGRDDTAKAVSAPGDICFWTEDDRVIIAFGPTPIAKGSEWLLPKPCNVWAKTRDDVSLLRSVTPGEKVSVTVA